MSKNVAVLGLGIVGSRVRTRLIDAAWNVKSWTRTPRGLEGETNTPAEAVRGATFVSIYLKDATAVRETFSEISTSLEKGCLLLNHATIDLATTHWLAEQCAAIGVDFLDTPFTGSKEAAASGKLLYYTGGDESLAEKASDFLAVSSRGRIHCGDIGTATIVKLATNLIVACTVEAMSESLALVSKNGVRPEALTEAAMSGATGCLLMEMKYPSMLSGDFETHFSMSNMLKDSRYALDLAAASGIELPSLAAVSKRMATLCDSGLGDLDFSALSKAYDH